MPHTVLHIDSSARLTGSTTRDLTQRIVEKLGAETVIRRDLKNALPQIDENWVNANFTPVDDRSVEQKDRLALSDQLVKELQEADTIVIGAPIYNFSIPGSLKAWIDLIARAGLTFKYTENGPQGLLEGKRAIIAISSGGTPIGSEIDFNSGYLKHIMGFIGITDVEIVGANQMMVDADAALAAASEAVERIAA